MTESFQNAWYEDDIAGGCFAIKNLAKGVTPSSSGGECLAFEVDDVDKAVETLWANGPEVKIEPFSTPVCRVAAVVDSERNAVTWPKMVTS